jgi:RND family efflux transporter MFP subunit
VEDRDRKAAIAELNAITKRIQASQADLAEAEAALQQAQASANLANEELQNARVVAPFAGTVGDIPVKIGDFVETSDELTSVTQNQSLELELAIPIERRSQLRLGTRVELTDAQNKPLGTGQISFISPTVAANAQSILAKAAFNNSQGQLLDRQYVKAKVIWQEGPGVLVPTAAISRLGGQTFVFVAEEPEPAARVSSEEAPPQPEQPTLVAEQRLVELGSLQGNNYQVLEGLQPGERIVTSGILNLSDGVPITPQP